MSKAPNNRIKLKLWQPNSTTEFDGGAAEGILYAALSLSSEERLKLIEQLQAKHAEIDARFR